MLVKHIERDCHGIKESVAEVLVAENISIKMRGEQVELVIEWGGGRSLEVVLTEGEARQWAELVDKASSR